MPQIFKSLIVLLPLLFAVPVPARDAPGCANTLGQLKVAVGDPAFPLQWEETTMQDGKPLLVSILERDGTLLLEFIKTNEGLWVETSGVVCKTDGGLEARFDGGQVRLGPAAHWVLRLAIGNGGTFKLTRIGANQLEIVTRGWRGIFSPSLK
jgi:hypothetical protein